MASEIAQVVKTMEVGNHFLLSGGAGSGKTHSLIELIEIISESRPTAKIACITYTNVAADEIKGRASKYAIQASTIHDFLWDSVKGFQSNLKTAIVDLYDDVYEEDLTEDMDVEYREFRSLKKGIISHNEVITIAKHLFEKYLLISKILSDKFDYLFVDEYQDTSEDVIQILFNHLNNEKFNLKIGLFGDSMQSIYDGVGEIDEKELTSQDWQRNIEKIEKSLNRRSPQSVIDLANNLRTDGLQQKAQKNSGAPNNDSDGTIKIGNAKFLFSSSASKIIKDVLESKLCSKWDFKNFDEKGKPLSKVLLTRNRLIAENSRFNSLFELYEKDKIIGQSGFVKRIKEYVKTVTVSIDLESCTFLDLLNKLVNDLYADISFKDFIELVRNEIPNFNTIQKAINKVNKDYDNIKKVLPTGGMFEFIFSNESLFETVLNMPYSDVSKIFINKDKLIGQKKSNNANSNKRNDEKDPLIKFLYRIQEILMKYKNDDIIGLIKDLDFKIEIGSDKQMLKQRMDDLVSVSSLKIGDVLTFIGSSGLLYADERTQAYINSNPYLLQRISQVEYAEIMNIYNFTEGLSSYSTQHGVKGEEFENVLVVISEEKIPQLSICYKYLFENQTDQEKYFERTKNLFYVACTRAKENLVVFFEGNCSEKAVNQAEKWFGDKNVIDLDKV